MMNLYDILKKYKVTIISASIIIFIGTLLLFFFMIFNKSSSLKQFENTNYVLKYDNSWKIKQKKDTSILLKHKSSDSTLNIEIIKLDSDYKYYLIEDLVDEIIYNIEKQNSNYKLISKKDFKFTKYKFNGYKLLYENELSQTMISFYKKSDKLIMTYFSADNNYFDILLDSVQSIIHNFDIKEEKFDLASSIKLDTEKIAYSNEEKIEKLLLKNSNYEIASNNYYVSYSIPSNFQISALNTNYNYFDFKDFNLGNIKISASIMIKNIYEYLDKDNKSSLYQSYNIYKTSENYSDFKESVGNFESNYESYIYINSYNYIKNSKNKEDVQKNENIELIYALNKNHIFIIKISSSNVGIPKKLIDMIKVNKSSNYSSYIKINKKDGYLISELKRFTDYDKNKIDNITIKIPDKYTEYEENDNIYENRYYGLNYSEENEMYDYNVKYKLTNNLANDEISYVNIINSSFSKSYGEYNELTFSGNIKLNNKNFNVYTGGYTNLGGIMFTNINRYKYYIYKKALFYKLETGGYLIIEISGNGKKINDEILNEVTNFNIEQIKS